jgi:hypothetical protein
MKIGEYKQMNAYLTRPGTPEQKKKAEENNAKYLAKYFALFSSAFFFCSGVPGLVR